MPEDLFCFLDRQKICRKVTALGLMTFFSFGDLRLVQRLQKSYGSSDIFTKTSGPLHLFRPSTESESSKVLVGVGLRPRLDVIL